MLFLKRGPWAALLIGVFFSAAAASTEDVLVSNLIEWLRTNGAYINPKLQIQHMIPSDPSSPRGIYTMETLEEGDTVCTIPWKLMIIPSDISQLQGGTSQLPLKDLLDCGTIDNVIEEITKDENEITPYGKYLLSQPRGYTAAFWSPAGKELFMEMTNDERLPPIWIKDFMDDWMEQCNGNGADPLHVFAAMLVKARADYQYLVPFYDMMNHHNDRYNVFHRYNAYKGEVTEQTGYELYAGKTINKGDQLFLSYNQCNICNETHDWFGTPEMFLQFGFVESLPQRWLFDFARIKFDLEWIDGDEKTKKIGRYNVNFLVPPSKEGMDMLRKELAHLDSFEQTLSNTQEGIPESEMRSLREYYNALHLAIRLALDSNAALVDDVWKMDDDWWVTKYGSLVADHDTEHTIRPSKLRNVEL